MAESDEGGIKFIYFFIFLRAFYNFYTYMYLLM